MSYLALYRKYRPSTFDDLVGQNGVSSIIKNEILHNKISHAYLFSGPRGTGKTSTAKIIAKMINCFNLSDEGVPCGTCESCLNFTTSSDIVEIDAASNNGVDEIRDLRDKVNLVPTYGKYKIYIIDEVHMLTTQAFNALLKTLEEPPAHAIFILATTEFHKIPATVVSRCQKFQFLKFTNEEIVERLSKIASLENINIDNNILFEIARLADGGLRDAINMLDQLSSFKDSDININDLYNLNGVISYLELYNLLVCIKNNDISNIIKIVNEIDKTGKNIDKFISDLISFLKDVLVYKNTSEFEGGIEEKNSKIVELSNIFAGEEIYEMIFSLNDLSYKVKNSGFSIILLVTYFIKASNDLNNENKHYTINNNVNLNSIKSKGSDDSSISTNLKVETNIVKKNSLFFDDSLKKIRINNAFSTASKTNKDNFLKKWDNINDNLDMDKYSNLVGVINDIDVMVVGDKNVIFLVKYDSLLERIYSYLKDFERLLLDIFEVNYKVIFIANDEWLYEKDKYIKNIKSGKKYTYMEEKEEASNIEFSSLNDKKNMDDVDKIISFLGEEVISYK